jgi:hypothetical protein
MGALANMLASGVTPGAGPNSMRELLGEQSAAASGFQGESAELIRAAVCTLRSVGVMPPESATTPEQALAHIKRYQEQVRFLRQGFFGMLMGFAELKRRAADLPVEAATVTAMLAHPSYV